MNAPHPSWDTLNAYADDTLTDAVRAALDPHVRACQECRDQIARIDALRAAARALPPNGAGAAPEQAWSAIRSRVDAAKVVALGAAVAPSRRNSAWLAAAAVALIAASSATTALLMRSADPAQAPAIAHDVLAPDHGADAVMPASLASVERDYIRTVDELTSALALARATLAPETIRAVERNLRIIDDAITEARAALLRDPASDVLASLLSKHYQQKVDLLRRVSTHAEVS